MLNHVDSLSASLYTVRMVEEVAVSVPCEKESDEKFIFAEICSALKKKGAAFDPKEAVPVLVKKSVDARRKNIKLFLKYKVYIGENPSNEFQNVPKWKKAEAEKTVAIVGSGPAGLFGALKLLEYGIKPVIIERGCDVFKRKRDIAEISRTKTVNENSNYCFGEGGAGTFSDGKLFTRSSKRGNISGILNIFIRFGADKKIATDAHPHIGTDRLPAIVRSIRDFIVQSGGEIHFETRCADFIIEERDGEKTAAGIVCENVHTHEKKNLYADAVLLAAGHSAHDIYRLLASVSPESLEAKPFAMGVRVEHPRETIDLIQFHGRKNQSLGAAEYRLAAQADGRGVYSFCMCPGGFVVPSSTGPEEIALNGMSAAGRNSKWSNAAVVVEIRPEDIPQEFISKAKEDGTEKIAGLLFRQHLEHLTFIHGENQKAPAQRLEDFLLKRKSDSLPESSYAPGLVSSALHEWLPAFISGRLHKAFQLFDRSMKGFVCSDALLVASETRTSTPVRILRGKDSRECVFLRNLFPAGEGSGYSGGIVSSAIDGENSCVRIAEKLGCSK